MMNSKKIFELIGIAFLARKIIWGEMSCIDAIKNGLAFAVSVSTDAGENTRKKINHFSQMYNVPVLCFASKYELGSCIGKKMISVMVIADENFANKAIGLVENIGGVDSSGKNSCL